MIHTWTIGLVSIHNGCIYKEYISLYFFVR